jgi:hypothetical protein
LVGAWFGRRELRGAGLVGPRFGRRELRGGGLVGARRGVIAVAIASASREVCILDAWVNFLDRRGIW